MTWESLGKFGALPAGTVVKKGAALFPRLDIEKELAFFHGEKEAAAETPKAEKPGPGQGGKARRAREGGRSARGNHHRRFRQGEADFCQGARL